MGLYAGLQAFFAAHPALQRRPFFAAGESYAGKFVPSLGGFHELDGVRFRLYTRPKAES